MIGHRSQPADDGAGPDIAGTPSRLSTRLRTSGLGIALLLAAFLLGGPRAQATQVAAPAWSAIPDRFLVVGSDGETSRCGWFVTLEDRLIALRSRPDTPAPDRRDHEFPKVRAVVEATPNHQPLPMPGLMLTADGQRLPGEPRVVLGKLLWRNRWTGEVAVPLEELAAVRLAPDGTIPEATDADAIELVNGDRVNGLVASIGVDVAIEDPATAPSGAEREAVSIPLERVRSIRLLSAPIDPQGPRAWFSDGTIASGRIVADEESGGMRFIPRLPASSRSEESERQSIRVRPEDLRAYLPEVSQVVGLATVPVQELLATGTWPSYAPPEFSVSRMPGPADAPDVVVNGPGAVRWKLPPGKWTFVSEVMTEAPSADWTSFDLVVRDGTREVLRRSFSAESSAIEIRVPIESPELSIEVTEGERGPIADAIRLRRAMLLRR